ncbi:hypothetical protein HMN09_01155700 [Mycena chlorophos]|uniref:Uncharacterized protein n=1 Tax=Mycena chlorophos TaxID=658473 RepID=A0A8H6VW99_MYCCL|nr:hypothetical protein HMN09_01155700 [Mycena chlorophos]
MSSQQTQVSVWRSDSAQSSGDICARNGSFAGDEREKRARHAETRHSNSGTHAGAQGERSVWTASGSFPCSDLRATTWSGEAPEMSYGSSDDPQGTSAAAGTEKTDSNLRRKQEEEMEDRLASAVEAEVDEGMALAAGSRVSLLEAPTYVKHFREGYIIGFFTSRHATLAIVRVTCGGERLDCNGQDLVERLRAYASDEDVITLLGRHIRRHGSAEDDTAVIGDRVESVNGVVPRRCGVVERVEHGSRGKIVRLRDAVTGTRVDLWMWEVRRRFEEGDRVRVVGGFYAGKSGMVRGTVETMPAGYAADEGEGGLEVELWDGQYADGGRGYEVVKVIKSQVRLLELDDAGHKAKHWLCGGEALVQKRLDVRVGDFGQGSWNETLERSMGKTGFIELERAMTERTLDGRVEVYLDEMQRRIRVAARSLQPVRTCRKKDGAVVSLCEAPSRVVVIGRSCSGGMENYGRYGMVVDHQSTQQKVVVRWFEREGSDEFGSDCFPLESLCRSTNVDGKRTTATRFR